MSQPISQWNSAIDLSGRLFELDHSCTLNKLRGTLDDPFQQIIVKVNSRTNQTNEIGFLHTHCDKSKHREIRGIIPERVPLDLELIQRHRCSAVELINRLKPGSPIEVSYLVKCSYPPDTLQVVHTARYWLEKTQFKYLGKDEKGYQSIFTKQFKYYQPAESSKAAHKNDERLAQFKNSDESKAKSVSYTNSRVNAGGVTHSKDVQDVLDRHRKHTIPEAVEFLTLNLNEAKTRQTRAKAGGNMRVLTKRLESAKTKYDNAKANERSCKMSLESASNLAECHERQVKVRAAMKETDEYKQQYENIQTQMKNFESNDLVDSLQKDLDILNLNRV